MSLNRTAWAAFEVIVVLIFGILPLVVALIRLNMQADSQAFVLGPPLYQLTGQGQLFFYSFSLMGTLIWLAIADFRFKANAARVTIALFIVVLSIFITATGIFDPTLPQTSKGWTFVASIFAFALVYILYFSILLINTQQPASAKEALDNGAAAMAKKAEELVG